MTVISQTRDLREWLDFQNNLIKIRKSNLNKELFKGFRHQISNYGLLSV